MARGNPPAQKPRLVLGVNYKERKNNPPPGLEWRQPAAINTKGRPTLGSIADFYDITWQDLVMMNFRTLKPREINWYLHAFVGCENHNGTWYQFSGTDKPGYILVPERPPSSMKADPARVRVVRGGQVKRNMKLWVHVVERRAHGVLEPVRGKWLYVFSGDGRNFGRANQVTPPLVITNGSRELPRPGNPDDYRPWSALELTFQGTFEIAHGPDRLDYEVYITADKAPSQDLVKDLTGVGFDAKQDIRCELGGKWYVISDQRTLGKALSEPRFQRTHHALRNHQRVPIDLMKDGASRRYYFFLSPVQLGPEALKYAMANPQRLTPLLKPGYNGQQWDPDDPSADKSPKLEGPQPGDFKDNQHTLGVIDPYAWAEDIAQNDMSDKVT